MSETSKRETLLPDKISEAYENDKEFKEYVDRYCACRSVSVFEALAHITVKEVADFYKKARAGRIDDG